MTSAMVYWILMLDNIRGLLIGTEIAAGLLVFVSLLAIGVVYDNGDKPNMSKKMFVASVIAAMLLWPLIAFTPSTKQACVIYLAPKVINNEQVQKVPENVLKLLNTKMEEWIGEQIATDPEPEPEKE